jgi:3-oxoadipate CoA-transferase alpha subunit
VTIAQVTDVVDVGALDPEAVVTPSIFVQRIVPITPNQQQVHGAPANE